MSISLNYKLCLNPPNRILAFFFDLTTDVYVIFLAGVEFLRNLEWEMSSCVLRGLIRISFPSGSWTVSMISATGVSWGLKKLVIKVELDDYMVHVITIKMARVLWALLALPPRLDIDHRWLTPYHRTWHHTGSILLHYSVIKSANLLKINLSWTISVAQIKGLILDMKSLDQLWVVRLRNCSY